MAILIIFEKPDEFLGFKTCTILEVDENCIPNIPKQLCLVTVQGSHVKHMNIEMHEFVLTWFFNVSYNTIFVYVGHVVHYVLGIDVVTIQDWKEAVQL